MSNTSWMEQVLSRGKRRGRTLLATVAVAMAVHTLAACTVELAPEAHPADPIVEPSLVERIDEALEDYARAGGVRPIGDGAAAYLAAMRSVISGEPDPLYGHSWGAWKGQLLVATHAELTEKARAYADEDDYFADIPAHRRARALLGEAADAVDGLSG